MRKRFILSILSVLVLVSNFSTSLNSVCVYADTVDRIELLSDNSDEDIDEIEPQQMTLQQNVILDDDELYVEIPDNNSDEISFKKEIADTGSRVRMITGIEPPETDEITLDHKIWLQSVLDMLPDRITVYWSDDRAEELDVEWKCLDDYDDELSEYSFIPVLDEYILSDEVIVPKVKLQITKGAEEDNNYGYIKVDLPFDIPLAGNNRRLKSSSSYYDNREALPDIRSQNPYETCWSFATIGAAEADLIADGKADRSVDLSEIHTAYYASHGYSDPKGCREDMTACNGNWLDNGGNPIQAYRLLSNLVGMADEKTASYSEGIDYDPGPEHAFDLDCVQVRGAYLINVNDRDGIRKAIREHGGVITSYYDSNSWYSDTYNSYYCPDDHAYTNHAVMFVGWNDDFPRNNFKGVSKPEGDGAWLVRNSWGVNEDSHKGYFWISYYDKGFLNADDAIAIDACTDMYDFCYAYDGQPTHDTVIPVNESQVISVDYDVNAGEELAAIGIEFGTANVSVDATVTNKDTGASVEKSMKTTYAGFYTLDMSGIDFTADSEVEISLVLKADNADHVDVIAESLGECDMGCVKYIGKCDGGFMIDGDKRNFDPRIKLYTNKAEIPVVIPKSVKLDKTSAELMIGEEIQLTATVMPSEAYDKRVAWSSSDPSVATVDSKGYITAVSLGETVVTVKTLTGGKTASCTVTVEWLDRQWRVVEGKSYWYEKGVKQGTYSDPKGVIGDGTVRGREIYDPASNAWYWLDSVYDGAKAVGKEVWIPYIYQDEKKWDDAEIRSNANASDPGMRDQAYKAIKEGYGKWVRYDENGKMMKGWVTISGGLALIYPKQRGNVYYYDNKTGLMAKGRTVIDGKTYHFDEVTGVLK